MIVDFTIPGWVIVLAAVLAPFLVGIVSSILHRPTGQLFDFDLLTPFLFVIAAAMCWTGVAVWLVMR